MIEDAVAKQYDNFQTTLENNKTEKKYLNYGYSTSSAQSYEKKQEALCLEVFGAANIQPGDVIVDVGFGSGEQDFLVAKKFKFKKLIGFNIAGKQVAYANARAKKEKLDKRLTFHKSPAENMPKMKNNSADKLVAVECAFYFDRPAFYKEAGRILKPGGRLVLADICLPKFMSWVTSLREDMQRVGSINGNQNEWEKYFNTISVRSISKHTRPGCQMTVYKIIKNIRTMDDDKEQKSIWKQMAIWSQIIAWGLALGIVRYDLIILETK